MPYNANIPQPTDLLKNSQVDILNDFLAVNTIVQVDHVPFSSDDEGKHIATRFPIQASSPATAATELALFSRASQNPAGFGNVLCTRDISNGAVVEFTAMLNAASGWTRLPNGQLFKWSTANIAALGAQAKVWPVAGNIPVFTSIQKVMIINKANGNFIKRIVSVVQGTVTVLGLTLYSERTQGGPQAPFDVYVLGIGAG